jgi:hypothetical protein
MPRHVEGYLLAIARRHRLAGNLLQSRVGKERHDVASEVAQALAASFAAA